MCVLILLVSTYCTVWLTLTSMQTAWHRRFIFWVWEGSIFCPPPKIKVIISLIYVILTQFSRDVLLSDSWQEWSCICLAAVFCHPSLYKNNIFRENVWKKTKKLPLYYRESTRINDDDDDKWFHENKQVFFCFVAYVAMFLRELYHYILVFIFTVSL